MSLESQGIALLTASTVRPFVLAVAAWVILWVFRVRHPASRHAVWTAVLVGMLLLPFVSVISPHWKLPVLPQKHETAASVPVSGSDGIQTFEPLEPPDPLPQPSVRVVEIPTKSTFKWLSTETLVIGCYLAGLFAMVAYRMLGWAMLWRVMSRSRLVWAPLLRESGDVLAPVAVGLLRPVVILPAGWRTWSAKTKRAVLAHEFAHLRRHDALVSVLAWWVRFVFWFHPLAWWVSRKVSDLAELACDAKALERVGDPVGYSRMLLGFADAVNRAGHRVALPGLAMAAGSGMDRRVDSVFEVCGGNMKKLARPGVLLAIAGVPVVCLAATVGLGEMRSRPTLQSIAPAPPIVAQSVIPALDAPAVKAPRIVAQQSAAPAMAAQPLAPPRPAARPEFEVASIRLSSGCVPAAGGGRGGRGMAPSRQVPVTTSPGRLHVDCQSVMELIQMAYDRYASGAFGRSRPLAIEGAPAWTQSERYTIEAKGDASQKDGMMRGPMMQSLLENRFQLKIRRETRQVPVYELTVAKGGPKLEPFQEGSCTPDGGLRFEERDPDVHYCGFSQSFSGGGNPNTTNFMERMTLDDFSKGMPGNLDRPVINKTGISGLFNIRLEYADEVNSSEALQRAADAPGVPPGLREQMLAVVAARANGPAAISIFTALQQQLGLKLEKATGPGEFLIVDSVQRPSEN